MVSTGSTTDRQSWEERYSSSDHVWSGRPNPSLQAEATGLPPGHALDLGCGEGADAVWLAEHGWRVTAVDFAAPALERGRAAALERGVAERIEWLQADLAHWPPPQAAFDLVNVQYLHLRDDDAEVALLRRAATAVAPGGRLLVAGHDGFPTSSTNAPSDVVFRTPHQTMSALALPEQQWWVEVAERRARPADPGHGHEPRPDHVLLVRRLA